MVRKYHDICSGCLTRDLEIQTLTRERNEARQHAVRWETEAHALRKELQALRMNCDTERITRKHP
jgi:hypothetical protein